MVAESEEWISAAEALKMVSAVPGHHQARRAICSRAHAGLIEARAVRLMDDHRIADNRHVPKEFWWSSDEATLTQNWTTGDFETWINQERHLRAFGVEFSRHGIEALIGPAIASRDVAPDPPAPSGGRPAAAWWDDLWIEMCRQLWTGRLQPKKQSEIEGAMMGWTSKHGHNPGESTIRPRARKLWTALQKEDEN